METSARDQDGVPDESVLDNVSGCGDEMEDVGDVDEALLNEEQPAAPALTHTKERSVNSTQVTRGFSEIISVMSNARLNSNGDDNVFEPVTQHHILSHPPLISSAGDFGSGNTESLVQVSAPAFPPMYNVIRASKNKQLGQERLGSALGFSREAVKPSTYNGGLAPPDDFRALRAQNYHSMDKGLNISFSISRPQVGGGGTAWSAWRAQRSTPSHRG
jgi:hypothetical protein